MHRRLEAADRTVGKEDGRIDPAVVLAAGRIGRHVGRTGIEADRIDQLVGHIEIEADHTAQLVGHIEIEADRTAQPVGHIEIEAGQVSGHTVKRGHRREARTVLAWEPRQACIIEIISGNPSVK